MTTPAWVIMPRAAASTLAPTGFTVIAEGTDQAEIFLATLTIRAKGSNPARTVRVSDREFTDADGNRYDTLVVDKSTLDAGGAFLTATWQPVDLDLVVADGMLGSHNLRFSQLLYRYDLVGSAVTVKLGAEGLAVASFPTIFEGEVSEVVDISPTEVRLRCVQDRKWILPLPDRTIQRNDYPDASLASIGLPVPTFWGNFSLGRWTLSTLPGSANTSAYLAGVARAPIPMIPVNAGADGAQPSYVAGRQLSSGVERILIVDRNTNQLMGTPSVTVATDAVGNYRKTLVSTEFSQFYLAVLGVDKDGTTTAENWLESSRDDKNYTLSGFSLLDYDAGKTILRIALPDIPAAGRFTSATCYLWYAKNASSASHPRFGIKHDTAGDDFADLPAGASATYPSDTPQALATVACPKVALWGDIGKSSLYVEVRAAGQKVQVHRICLVIKHLPALSLVRSGSTTGDTQGTYTVQGRKDRPYWNDPNPRYKDVRYRTTPDVFAFDYPAYTYDIGPVDDGSGTYTGTASAVIEHPGAVVHHLLRTFAGLSASNITTAASTFGSFTDLRSSLANYKALVYVSEAADCEDVVNEIGRQFMVWFYRRHHAANSPWVAVPWGVPPTLNYRSTANVFTFTHRYIVGAPQVGMSPISGVRPIIRVNYDYDLRTRTYAQACYITDTDSRGYNGAAGGEIRDESGGRELQAAESVTLYGRREYKLNLTMVNDPATAVSIRNRAFDLLYRPRVEVRFRTFLNAFDLERGMVIRFSEDFDSIFPFPGPGTDGSWYGKIFQVVRTTRREAGATTYDVEAVEV